MACLDVVAGNLLGDEAVKGIVVNCHDITLRKMVENKLIWERNLLRTLLEFYRQPGTQVQDIVEFVVEQCVKISESRWGFRVHR